MKKNDSDVRIAELQQENEALSQQVKRLIKAEGKLYQYQEELDAQLKEYKDLYELNKKLNTTFDIEKIFEYAVAYATRNLEYERAVLFERVANTGGYHVCAIDGYYDKQEKSSVSALAIKQDDPFLSPLFAGREYLISKSDAEEKELVEFRAKLRMNEYFIYRLGTPSSPHAILAVGNSAENAPFYRKVSDSPGTLLSIGNLVGLISSSIEKHIYYRKMETALEQERLAEARYRSIFENAVEGIFQTTPSGQFLTANPAMARIMGYASSQELLENVTDINRQLYVEPECRSEIQQLLEERGTVEGFDTRYYRKDGSVIWVSISARAVRNDTGQILYYEGTAEDITERKWAEEALKESEERYRSVVETALDAVITIDEESRIIFANSSAERIFGYAKAEMAGRQLTMLMPERLRDAHLASIKRHIETGERSIPWKAIEFPGLHKDGREIPLEISYGEFVKEGKYFFTGIVRDITERKKAEETIKYQAYHDLLTGLPNRAQLMLRLGLESTQAQHNQKELAVLHLDLDRFRTINDTLGHAVGDQVILAVAERLKALIRANDTLSRIGSDEFIILLADLARAEEAALFARKLVDAMRKPFRIDDRELYATASIGISIYPEDSKIADVLLKNADIAVSHVKERGRNNFQFFNPTLNRRTVERLLLESDLRQTLERGELVLHYQPQVSIRTGEIMCLEALVRWKHADLGMLGPTQFIPAAEEIGFITAIDEWVLRAACVQNKAWQDAGYPPLCITVNLSAQQFQQPTLVELVSGIVHETGMDPHYLGIEVTESTAMRDIELAIPNLRGLHSMGIKLSIDDFGTGYSSMNYLKRFPIQKLKIDQSFIRGVAGDPDDQAIVDAVIAMGHSLQLGIIAEGVETEEQLSFLRSHTCDEMQGFLFSKPLPAEEFSKLIAANGKQLYSHR